MQLKSLALILSGSLVLAACGSSVKLDDKAAVEERTPTATTAPSADTRSVNTVTTGSVDPLTQGVLAKRSVYFDYDSYIVKDEFKPVVEAHGKFLTTNKARKVVIQGNTDERGGREYNLALGQKRAEAVRKSLSLLGVPESQMEAVSFGKEKPKATGSDEASWAENRRADIVYQ
ncbi:peptidoglycan-associated lipoprotein Pal [Noviherbaspirillum galbum]|uniref:Peptidoglycan-associated lipoprotein n=1 Tax=Noviherbaspirillum galbum TaxID=2709383 RepID=A0A6B3SPC4_9BURK|nr:peptidoglycan-associated lipoprotein Pal [Noviherbaspirillum galbum]NEX60262.1 peptidoglycan-associated lipoprotein Pal [Noviherbaspirillum galbum]